MKSMAIVGAKSFPNRYGGFETLVETLLHSQNFLSKFSKITIIVEDNPSLGNTDQFDNVDFISLGLRKSKTPFRFYWKSLLKSKNHDAVLILGLGAGFFLPIIKLLYPKVILIVNLDGLEWRRRKFNYVKRFILYLLSICNLFYADKIIFDNEKLIEDFFRGRRYYNRKGNVIAYSSRFELQSKYTREEHTGRSYMIAVSRFVPENNVELLCDAYVNSSVKNKLNFIFVGDAENYSVPLKEKYPQINFTGPIYDLIRLRSLLEQSSIYLHGHTVGGTNPALVEAIHLGCNLVCHGNKFNIDTTKGFSKFFTNQNELISILDNWNGDSFERAPEIYERHFSSRIISEAYLEMIEDAINIL